MTKKRSFPWDPNGKPLDPKKLMRELVKRNAEPRTPHAFDLTDRFSLELWVQMTLARHKEILGRYMRGQRAGWKATKLAVETKADAMMLTILRKKHRLVWLVENGRVGSGELEGGYEPEYVGWEVVSAAIASAYRRLGVYRAVLTTLKDALGSPIWSSRSLTRPAAAVWKSVGTFDEARQQHHNPKRNAVLWMYQLHFDALREALNHYATTPRPA